ncbi:MAG: cytochrome c oxidase subunit 3 [Psychroflexus salarius]|jgi:cytochrome c oxidase subunit 3
MDGDLNNKKQVKAKKMMLWFGIISMSMTFAGLTSAYVVSKSRPDWLSEYALPQIFLYSTIIIIISSFTFHFAKTAIKNNNRSLANSLMLVTLILGALFVYMQFAGFDQIIEDGYHFTGAASNVRMSFVYVLVVAHLAHILGGLIVLLVVIYNHFRKKYTASNMLGFELGLNFWHFVDALWVYLFLFLYFFK